MNAEETKSFVKKFYETLYEKFRDVSEVLIKIPIVEGNEPMWEEGSEPDKDGWVTWRLLPAQVSDDEIAELGLHTAAVPTDMAEALVNANAIVFACPLYVDGIPGHLLSCLTELERQSQTFLWQTSLWQGHKPLIYGIVNCGFYEGVQAQYALDVLRNWAAKSGCTWGGGIGVGGGGGLTQMPTVKGGHGRKAPVEKPSQPWRT